MKRITTLAIALIVGTSLFAQPTTITDGTTGTATNDGTVGAAEYAGSSSGINSGFGNVFGSSSSLHFDSDRTGVLSIGLESGGGGLFNTGVIYIDAGSGGFTSTSSFTDNGDPGRAAVSGIGFITPAGRADITFAAGFDADYAITIESSFAGLYSLSSGTHTFIKSVNLNPTSSPVNGDWEMDLRMSDLGLAAGDSFDYVATYGNPFDGSGFFRSDEFHGVAGSTVTSGNIGVAAVTLASGDFSTFKSISCNIICPGNVTVDNDAGQCGAAVSGLSVNGIDFCFPDSIRNNSPHATSDSNDASGTYPVGVTTFQFIATDSLGNEDTCTVMVTVNDTTDPVAVCPASIADVVIDGAGVGTLPANIGDGSSTDNCATITETSPMTLFGCADLGSQSVTLTADDGSGNTSVAQCSFQVVDNAAPVAICQDITIGLNASGVATITPSSVDGGSTDNCYIDTTYISADQFFCPEVGIQVVTLTLIDSASNMSTCNSQVTVTDPLVVCCGMTVSSGVSDASCNGFSDGDIDATPVGGTAPYSYAWDAAAGSQTSSTAAGLAAGTYGVTVTDNTGCTASGSASVTEPATLTTSASASDANCNGFTDGSASVSASGGTTPYSYAWDAGTGSQTTSTAASLGAGTYNVTVTDANGCTASDAATINEPTAVVASASASDASCNGFTDGSATVSASGGTPPYSYAWDASAGSQTTSSASSLGAATYGVTVTDATGCTASANATVNEPTGLGASASATDASCNGFSDGSVNVSASGGTPPYSYQWDAAAGSSTATTVNGLAAASYSVTVTDANGCTVSANATVNEPTALSAVAFTISPSCNGFSDGSAGTIASGGNPPYSYQWDASAGSQTGAIAGGLSAASYGVTVTDANGCTASSSATILEPSLLSVSASATDASCNGFTDGSVSGSATGGTGPYSYLWDAAAGSATSQTVNGLAAGTYSITATDANGCTASATATVNQPIAVTASASATDASCNGGSDGTATVVPGGGTAPYSFQWDASAGSQTTAGISGLAAGTYGVTVTDVNGCDATASATVNEPTVLALSASATDASCNGFSDGSVSSSASGGTPPYTYLWDASTGSATSTTVTGLSAGTYSVTATDANGCTVSGSATINEPAALSVGSGNTDATCNGFTDGSVLAIAFGGTAPYSYQWDAAAGSATTTTVNGLGAGSYAVVVTDANGCTANTSAIISEPAAVGFSTSVTDASCNGFSDGSVSASANGGTPPYTYLWDAAAGSATTTTVGGLAAGTYVVTATDANGCLGSVALTINAPTVVSLSTSATDASCNGFTDGTATANVSGGTLPYDFLWDFGTGAQTSVTADNLGAGTYSVTVTDNNGCSETATADVNEPSVLLASASATDATCNGFTDGTATASPSGGTPPYSYAWDAATGNQTSATAVTLGAGGYSVTVTDANGCTVAAGATVNEPSALAASASATDATCNGFTDGTATVGAAGGVAPYSYLWDAAAGSQTSTTAAGLGAGTYGVTVTDANGCTASASATVNEPTALIASTSATDASCNGFADGSVSVSASGGTPGYTYLWDAAAGSQTGTSVAGLGAGAYDVAVTDANGCASTATATINEPASLGLTIAENNASCNGFTDGSATVSTAGGFAPYSYAWDAATGSQTTSTASGLGAGSYGVTVTDANGCTAAATATITEPAAFTLSASIADVSCNGGSDGQIDLSVNGLNGFTFSFPDLTAGTYNLSVTDSNGCEETGIFTVNEPAPLVLSFVVTDASFSGASDGSIDISVSGGTPPYSYNWSNGSTSEDLSGVAAGNYDVTVTDDNGCTLISSMTVSEPTAVSLSTDSSSVSCFGFSDGTATVIASGGTAPYTYIWDAAAGNQTTSTAIGLAAGSYSATVTDNGGFNASASVTVISPGPFTLGIVVTDITCGGDSNGAINLTVNGGTPPHTISWSNGATTEDLDSLAAGSYNVVVTDANGCIAVGNATINEPGTLTSSTSTVSPSCNGFSNGSASVVPIGGSSPYTVQWDGATGNQNTPTATGLSDGLYGVIVTDNNGCTVFATADVIEPLAISLSASITDANGAGASNGAINLTVVGGTPNYTYLWSNGASTEDLVLLSAGTYTVTVTDINGCMAVDSFTVGETSGCGPGASVTGLNVPSVFYTKAQLAWDPLPGTVSWQLRGRPVGAASFVVLNIPNGAINSLNVFNLTPCTDYEWEIRALCNAGGTVSTLFSGLDTFSTLCCDPPDTTVVSNITCSSAQLGWNVIPGAFGYVVQGGINPVPPNPLVSVNSVGANNNSINATGLATNTEFVWVVRTGCNDNGSVVLSGPSAPVLFMTDSCGPGNTSKSAVEMAFESNVDVRMFPNPANSRVTFELSGVPLNETVSLALYDVMGQRVLDRSFGSDQPFEQFDVDVSKLANGYYEVVVSGRDWMRKDKLVVID